ncbi:MAG: hypothetical protein LAO03_16320 [Acidobacteriia bacterium]|nr:hypothetical protein [Terriglobia bacterium]
MKNALRIAASLAVILAATFAAAQSDAQKTFDRLKSLAGTWEGKGPNGQPGQVTYTVISGGSAVMSQLSENSMVTMYTVDGTRLLMTHYCGAGNQPRMVGTMSPDGKTLTFNFLDVGNLASPAAGHMHHAVFTFADADHYSEQWTWLQDGTEQVESFALQRKK